MGVLILSSLLCVTMEGQNATVIKPGTLAGDQDRLAFDCYRSFHKRLEMTGTFAKDLGINLSGIRTHIEDEEDDDAKA